MSVAKEEAQDSSLIKPGKSGSLTFKEWSYKHLHALFWGDRASHEKLVAQYRNPADSNSETTDNFSFFSSIFLMVYGIDGYDPATHMIIPAHRHSAGEIQEAYEYKGEPLPWLLLIAAFIGLPTRTGCSESTLPDYEVIGSETGDDDDPLSRSIILRQIPTLTPMGIWKNMFGGWDTLPDEDKYQEKKIWQWATLIPVKILIIFPIKFISIFFKLPINIIKIFTELLPSLAIYGLHIAMAKIYAHIADLDEDTNNSNALKIFGWSLSALFLSLLHMTLKLFTLVGRALFSPDKSARLASANGREVNKKLGFAVFYINKVITGIFWAITIPLLLGAAIIYFPNVVVPVITWFGNLPPIAAALHSMNGALVSFVTEFFAYDITPTVSALALLLHVPVPEAITVIGATLGFFGSSLVVILLSWLATPFSDKWAAWHEGGPFTTWLPAKWNAFTTYLSGLSIKFSFGKNKESQDVELKGSNDSGKGLTDLNPSRETDKLIGDQSRVSGSVNQSLISTARTGDQVEGAPPVSPSLQLQNQDLILDGIDPEILAFDFE